MPTFVFTIDTSCLEEYREAYIKQYNCKDSFVFFTYLFVPPYPMTNKKARDNTVVQIFLSNYLETEFNKTLFSEIEFISN